MHDGDVQALPDDVLASHPSPIVQSIMTFLSGLIGGSVKRRLECNHFPNESPWASQ
jgi:hypothetical protein